LKVQSKFAVGTNDLLRWRHRFADEGLGGLKDKPRFGKEPIYTKATDKRILALLDNPPPAGFARWTGPLLADALDSADSKADVSLSSDSGY
jgi:transposase